MIVISHRQNGQQFLETFTTQEEAIRYMKQIGGVFTISIDGSIPEKFYIDKE